MKIFKIMAIAMGCAATMAGCNDDDETSGPDLTGAFQTIVTYAGDSDSGSSFTVTEPGTDRLTTFTTPVNLGEKLKAGQRVLIYYTNASGKRYESGPIQFRAHSPIKDGKAQLKPQADISPLRVNPTEADLVEMSGKYVNVELSAAGSDGSLFDLYFDEATVDEAQPRAYVVFRSSNISSATHIFVGSFDISEVWDKPTCESIVVYYGQGKDTSRKEVFPKPSQDIKPME